MHTAIIGVRLQPLEWTEQRAPGWTWISWPSKVAERIPLRVMASNDRVVIVASTTDRGERNTVVWRSAVTRRVWPRCTEGRIEVESLRLRASPKVRTDERLDTSVAWRRALERCPSSGT